ETAMETFTTVTSLADIPPADRDGVLLTVLRSADAVVDATSGSVRRILPDLRREGAMRYIADVRGEDARDRAINDYESTTDCFLVATERARRECLNAGAPPHKLVLVPDAPSVTSASAVALLSAVGAGVA